MTAAACRRADPVRACIGCGCRDVRGRRYCRTCLRRLARGAAVDSDAIPTNAEMRRLAQAVPAPVSFTGRRTA